MNWYDVKKEYPNKWVLVKAINAKTENGKDALKEYAIKHKLNKNDEMYVYHSSKENLEILERVWMGVRKNG